MLFYDDVLQFQSAKVRAGTARAGIYYSQGNCIAAHEAFRATIKTKVSQNSSSTTVLWCLTPAPAFSKTTVLDLFILS